ncbi:hypothetical protein CEXT_107321 [Caerostris extrusa]|uniref:Ycf1 n=1 Tax=Caerostris extrusa TaxID=172846 RepID=A0AAV4VSR2_CAEEX|nr:hypothetical protein CEXT_107321 [Caerostris extrusa]
MNKKLVNECLIVQSPSKYGSDILECVHQSSNYANTHQWIFQIRIYPFTDIPFLITSAFPQKLFIFADHRKAFKGMSQEEQNLRNSMILNYQRHHVRPQQLLNSRENPIKKQLESEENEMSSGLKLGGPQGKKKDKERRISEDSSSEEETVYCF